MFLVCIRVAFFCLTDFTNTTTTRATATITTTTTATITITRGGAYTSYMMSGLAMAILAVKEPD